MKTLSNLKRIGWGAILWKRWEIKDYHKKNIITGFWAEDSSEYIIIVPEQLRGIVVEIQNYLSDIYNEIETLKRKIRKLEEYFEY